MIHEIILFKTEADKKERKKRWVEVVEEDVGRVVLSGCMSQQEGVWGWAGWLSSKMSKRESRMEDDGMGKGF